MAVPMTLPALDDVTWSELDFELALLCFNWKTSSCDCFCRLEIHEHNWRASASVLVPPKIKESAPFFFRSRSQASCWYSSDSWQRWNNKHPWRATLHYPDVVHKFIHHCMREVMSLRGSKHAKHVRRVKKSIPMSQVKWKLPVDWIFREHPSKWFTSLTPGTNLLTLPMVHYQSDHVNSWGSSFEPNTFGLNDV